jgi:uncharacterized protein YndB with AHSA1/START domain
VALLACTWAHAREFELTPAELARLERGDVVVRPVVETGPEAGMVRSAVRIDAPTAVVYRLMTDCAAARQYVPHLERCAVLEAATDGSWQLIEQQLDYGWFAPALDYVIRADYTADVSVDLRQVSGDFLVNEGRFELEELADGRGTLLRYRLRLIPPRSVPLWLQRRTVVRELPQMLRQLRQLSQRAAAADLQMPPRDGKMSD